MIYLVPCQGEPGPDPKICGHFGGCDWFAIIETDDAGVPQTLVPVPNTIHAPSPNGGHGHNMSVFEEHNVQAVVAVNMGMPMYRGMEAAGLTVYRDTKTASAVQAVAMAAAGELPLFAAEETHQHGPNGSCH